MDHASTAGAETGRVMKMSEEIAGRMHWGYRAFGAVTACLLFAALEFAATPAMAWNSTDMTGTLPALQFTMTHAPDGKTVTAADYKGKVVLLYFGYTYCPDVCPTTLFNIAQMLKALGKRADDVRVLFVTVDPNRDTLPDAQAVRCGFAPQRAAPATPTTRHFGQALPRRLYGQASKPVVCLRGHAQRGGLRLRPQRQHQAVVQWTCHGRGADSPDDERFTAHGGTQRQRQLVAPHSRHAVSTTQLTLMSARPRYFAPAPLHRELGHHGASISELQRHRHLRSDRQGISGRHAHQVIAASRKAHAAVRRNRNTFDRQHSFYTIHFLGWCNIIMPQALDEAPTRSMAEPVSFLKRNNQPRVGIL